MLTILQPQPPAQGRQVGVTTVHVVFSDDDSNVLQRCFSTPSPEARVNTEKKGWERPQQKPELLCGALRTFISCDIHGVQLFTTQVLQCGNQHG